MCSEEIKNDALSGKTNDNHLPKRDVSKLFLKCLKEKKVNYSNINLSSDICKEKERESRRDFYSLLHKRN